MMTITNLRFSEMQPAGSEREEKEVEAIGTEGFPINMDGKLVVMFGGQVDPGEEPEFELKLRHREKPDLEFALPITAIPLPNFEFTGIAPIHEQLCEYGTWEARLFADDQFVAQSSLEVRKP